MKFEALKDFYSSSQRRQVKKGEVIELDTTYDELVAKFGPEYLKEAVDKQPRKRSKKVNVEEGE